MPPEALEITRKFVSKPERILVKRDELTLEGRVETRDTLRSLGVSMYHLREHYRRNVDWLTDKMRGRDHTVSTTSQRHGSTTQLISWLMVRMDCIASLSAAFKR
ncbi:Eukaryotic initiation factor 4A-1 [Raphanus sativus]|nr:Eukaryotic initiation factor 4A-1 [Raphanus sativus]